MSPTLRAHGVAISPPAGFEGRVFRRPGHGEVSAAAADGPAAPIGEFPNTVVHLATIGLPPDVGDFASGAVDRLGRDDVLIVLFEYDSVAAGKGLFARQGAPKSITAADFDPGVLQRSLPGQAGCQYFFTEGGRAFCLYVVVGAFARRATLVTKVNAALATLVIDPLVNGSATPSTAPATSTTTPSSTMPPATTSPAPTSTTGPSTSTTQPSTPPTSTP